MPSPNDNSLLRLLSLQRKRSVDSLTTRMCAALGGQRPCLPADSLRSCRSPYVPISKNLEDDQCATSSLIAASKFQNMNDPPRGAAAARSRWMSVLTSYLRRPFPAKCSIARARPFSHNHQYHTCFVSVIYHSNATVEIRTTLRQRSSLDRPTRKLSHLGLFHV